MQEGLTNHSQRVLFESVYPGVMTGAEEGHRVVLRKLVKGLFS